MILSISELSDLRTSFIRLQISSLGKGYKVSELVSELIAIDPFMVHFVNSFPAHI